MIAQYEALRAEAEARLAAQSNAAARKGGWFEATWQNTGLKQKIVTAAHRHKPSPVRDSVFAATTPKWQYVREILAGHAERYPEARRDSISTQLKSMERMGMLEGRMVICSKYNKRAKQYRRVAGDQP